MTLLFDLDDTLLDDKATKNYYLPMLFKDFSHLINSDLQTFSNKWISAIPKYYQLYSEGKLSFEEQREQRVKEAFSNNEIDAIEIQYVLDTFDFHFSNSWKVFNEWKFFFNNSKLQKAIVTNGNAHQQNAKINKLGLRQHFDQIFISEEIGLSKPNPKLFQYVCEYLNVAPEDCIFIGDSWHYDIKSSNEFGMKSFWINHSEENHSILNKNIEVFNSINSIVQRLNEVERSVTTGVFNL